VTDETEQKVREAEHWLTETIQDIDAALNEPGQTEARHSQAELTTLVGIRERLRMCWLKMTEAEETEAHQDELDSILDEFARVEILQDEIEISWDKNHWRCVIRDRYGLASDYVLEGFATLDANASDEELESVVIRFRRHREGVTEKRHPLASKKYPD